MFLSNPQQLAVGTGFSNGFEEGPARERGRERLMTTITAMAMSHRRAIPLTATRPIGGPRNRSMPSRMLEVGLVCRGVFITIE